MLLVLTEKVHHRELYNNSLSFNEVKSTRHDIRILRVVLQTICILILKFVWVIYIDMIEWNWNLLRRCSHMIKLLLNVSYIIRLKGHLASYQNIQRQLWEILSTDWADLVIFFMVTSPYRGWAFVFQHKKGRGSGKDMYTISIYQINGTFFTKTVINVAHWNDCMERVCQERAGDIIIDTQIARFTGPTWGPSGSCRPQMGPCWPHEPCYQGIVSVGASIKCACGVVAHHRSVFGHVVVNIKPEF